MNNNKHLFFLEMVWYYETIWTTFSGALRQWIWGGSGLAPLQFIDHLSRPDFAKDWIVSSSYPLALRASSPVPRVL